MMRTSQWICRWMVVIGCGMGVLASTASASLTVLDPLGNGQKITVDSNTGYSWYWNMAGFINEDYSTQIADIARLNTLNGGAGYAGLTGWHMATWPESDDLQWVYFSTGELSNSFNPTGVFGGAYGFNGRIAEDYGQTGVHDGLYLVDGTGRSDVLVLNSYSGSDLSAWVVTNTSPQPVPVPGALLLGAIGVGMGSWLHRRGSF